jgi:8-oxo-dGTP diphosphatase
VCILHEIERLPIVKGDRMGAKEQGADATEGRWLVLPRSLCFVRNGNDVLMMKRGPHRRVFPNRYNGLGGHVERDEDPVASVRREVREESGLSIRDVRLRAINHIDAGSPSGIMLFVFTAYSDRRDVTASHEGTLHWIPQDQLLSLDLVEDLLQLLPRVLTLGDNAPPLLIHVGYDANDAIRMRFATNV